ncbi:GAF and ANTAR domain-containing protein [Rhodococcus opacus]|uniref:GAF and ANTAR domain-containing protein n=1 Tax=Rhodococcus opacus TaxID=37919 RepID=UPI001FF3C7B1|nr:GAF and ANTAR domain-containing protein [Rhodococcus opacus]UOT02028.1 GAF and ANTAR domain-containing protein [Rhodococcus opacus]
MRDTVPDTTRSQAVGKSAATFATLADLLYAGQDFGHVHQAICDAAPLLVEGCDHASLMLREGSRYVTAAASDDVAARVDEYERDENEGPCVDAIVSDTPQFETDLSTTSQWPRLSTRVLAHTPVRGAAGFRMVILGRKVGALNLFSDTAGALNTTSVEQGIMLASFAAVALAAVHEHAEAETLRAGLASNREIGKAVGLLMAFHNIPETQAMEILRTTSQDMNLKLAKVAQEIVAHHHRKVT